MASKTIAYPLTPLQSALLVAAARNPRSSRDVIQQTFTVGRAVRQDLLCAAWQRVLDRHEAPRCGFMWQGLRRPVQVVADGLAMPWRVVDWRSEDSGEVAKRLEEFLRQDREAGFELAEPPLMRMTLIRAKERDTLVWTYHHIILDGWSDSLILDEVMDCYASLVADRRWDPEPAVPLGQYLGWLDGQSPQAASAYWARLLKGFECPLPLAPVAMGGEPQSAHGVGTVELVVSEELTRELAGLAARCRVTANTMMHAAWALLEARLTGQRDVVFGTTVSGRNAPVRGIDSAVGMFLNTLPFRIEVPGESRIGPWLQEVQRRLLELREFEHSSIAEAHRHTAVPHDQPLFHTAFVFENVPRAALDRTDGLFLEARDGWGRTGFPLTVKAGIHGRLWVELAYEEDSFDRLAVERIAKYLERILTGLAADEATLDQVEVLDNAGSRRLLGEWDANDWSAAAALPPVPELIARQARAHGDRIAITCEGETITYGELDRRAGRLAHVLTGAGAGPERIVGICLPRRIDAVVAILAVMRAQAAYVPLDPAYPQRRLEFMLADSQAEILVTDARLAPLFDEAAVRTVLVGSSPDDDSLAVVGESAVPPADRLAYTIYTSGSTGSPKAAAIEHGGLARLIQDTNWITVTAGDVIAQTTNLSFDPSVFECWIALCHGARLAMISREEVLDPAALVAAIRRERVTVLFLTTMMMNRMIDEEPTFARGLRILMFGGESPDLARIQRLLACPDRPAELLHIYGPTEVSVYTSSHPVPSDHDFAQGLPVGRPMSNNSVYLLDDRLHPVPPGYPGDIWIGGPGVGRGYLRRPRLTAERFRPDPFADRAGARMYDSGDRGFRNADGSLTLLGRCDNQVKIRGHRVEPGEVEQALRQGPQLKDAVVQVDRASTQPRLVAYIVPVAGPAATAAQEAAARIRMVLPEHMVPSVFHVMDSLPVNVNGKVDRKALPAPEPARLARGDEATPTSAAEQAIARTWSQVLGVPAVGRDDDFFELGGHSLQAATVISLIGRELRVDLPLAALFERRTVSGLADLAEDVAAAAIFAHSRADGVLRLGGNGARALFLFHEGTGNVRRYIPLAGMLDDGFAVYGIHARGLDGTAEPLDDLVEMAARYVDAVREIQPSGPYRFGGWSFGGVVAIEAARQMRAAGQDVLPVVVIDSAPPSERLRKHLRDKEGPYDALHAIVMHTFHHRPWPPGECRHEIVAALRRCELNPHLISAGPEALSRLARVASANRRALATYRFTPYAGEVRLFLARDGFAREIGPEIVDDWRECVNDLAIDWVTGEHLTVVDEPHIRPVAAAIREM